MDYQYILAFNSGSSSLKFAQYEFSGASERLLLRGEAENIGPQSGHLWLRDAAGSSIADQARAIPDHEMALRLALDALKKAKAANPFDIGHRVVNGGSRYSAPQKNHVTSLERIAQSDPSSPRAFALRNQNYGSGRFPGSASSPGRLLRYRIPSQASRSRAALSAAPKALR